MTSLARILEQRGMTHKELSQRSGVARSRITLLSTGREKIIAHISVVVALAWALDIPPSALQDICDKPLPMGPRVGEKAEEERTIYERAAQDLIEDARSLLELFRSPRVKNPHYTRALKMETTDRLSRLEMSLKKYDLLQRGGRRGPEGPRLFT